MVLYILLYIYIYAHVCSWMTIDKLRPHLKALDNYCINIENRLYAHSLASLGVLPLFVRIFIREIHNIHIDLPLFSFVFKLKEFSEREREWGGERREALPIIFYEMIDTALTCSNRNDWNQASSNDVEFIYWTRCYCNFLFDNLCIMF